jgi:hypothetical protein
MSLLTRTRGVVIIAPVLKFCVALYCQQGFDPATAKTSLALIPTKDTPHGASGAHAADACSPRCPPARRQTTR